MGNALRTILTVAGPGLAVDEFPWERLRHEHTGAIRASLVAKYAPRTVNRMLAALRGVLRMCWRQGLMTDSDYHHAIDVKSAKVSGHVRAGRMIPPDEIARLYAACEADGERGVHDGALVAVLLRCGLRRAEACALDVGDYNPTTGALLVRHGKGDKARTVYLPTKTRARFELWWHRSRGLDVVDTRACVFRYWGSLGCGGRLRPDEVGAVLARLAARAEVPPFTAHDFRRTFATALLDAGANIAVVRDLMGHGNVNTTAGYDRSGEKAKQLAVELLNSDED